jgi:hypothetical protein
MVENNYPENIIIHFFMFQNFFLDFWAFLEHFRFKKYSFLRFILKIPQMGGPMNVAAPWMNRSSPKADVNWSTPIRSTRTTDTRQM